MSARWRHQQSSPRNRILTGTTRTGGGYHPSFSRWTHIRLEKNAYIIGHARYDMKRARLNSPSTLFRLWVCYKPCKQGASGYSLCKVCQRVGNLTVLKRTKCKRGMARYHPPMSPDSFRTLVAAARGYANYPIRLLALGLVEAEPH